MKTIPLILLCSVMVAGAQIYTPGSGGTSTLNTNDPVAWASTFWTQELQVGSLSYSSSLKSPSNETVVVSFTNTVLCVVNVTNTSVTIAPTNWSHGAVLTLLLNGNGSAKTVMWGWPEDVFVRWRNGTNTTLTNETIVSFLCETNTTGTNRIQARADVQ